MIRHSPFIGLMTLILVVAIGAPSIVRASGDTLGQFIEKELDDVVRVYFFGPDYVSWSRNVPPKALIPKDKAKRTSVRPVVSYGEMGKTLECSEIRLASWYDWQDEVKANAHDKDWVSLYQYWNSPSYMRVQASHKYLIWQSWPVKVSIAIIGEDFDIYRLFDRKTGALRGDLLAKMRLLKGRAYARGGTLLDTSEMEVLKRTGCTGFTIFNLIFRKSD